MKTLTLMRHAKSSWNDGSLADRDRPLNARGRRAAPAMARWMADHDLVPDRVLCSPAVRTRETWALAAPHLGEPPADFPEELYGAPADRMLDVVRRDGGGAGRLLVVGHNPGLEALAAALAGSGSEEEMDRMAAKFPTAALAVFRFDADAWDGIHVGRGELVRFIKPRDLDPAP